MSRSLAASLAPFVVLLAACSSSEDANTTIIIEWDGYAAYFDIQPTSATNEPDTTSTPPADTSATTTAATDTQTVTETVASDTAVVDTAVSPADTRCHEGAKGCRCGPANECLQTGEALVCDAGWCVPQTCPSGGEGCACYGNGTCDARDGVPMTCAGNICVPTVVPAPGTLGGACDAEVVCGEPLVCNLGRCEDRGCPLGTFGCACGAFGACAPFQGQATRCDDGLCALGSCAPGSLGCTCDVGDACAPASTCNDGRCVATGELRLVVRGPVEACDIMLAEGDVPRLESITFEAHVLGHSEIRSPQAAMSFFTRDPAPLDGLVALVTLRAGAASGTPITISRATCFDALGRASTGATITLE